ncbi:MAG: type VI secretion system-associated FHA domain protein TagH [Pseudomonadales bacterium]|nr:type VI secretion system-associated FHA domain protein TagH [Pseudomonadales bacterium]
MSLELIIIRQPSGIADVEPRKTFGYKGGTIGRGDSNTWQLPDEDRFVSSYHAQIEFDNESYFLVDVSTNGVYINDSEEPIGEGNKSRIKHGDVVIIGDYEIRVCVGIPGYIDSPFAGMTAEMQALAREGISFSDGNNEPGQASKIDETGEVEKMESRSTYSPGPVILQSKVSQESAVLAAEIAFIEQQDNISRGDSLGFDVNREDAESGLSESVQEVIESLSVKRSDNLGAVENEAENIKQVNRGNAGDIKLYLKEQAQEIAGLLGIPSELIGEEKVEAVIQLMTVVLKESIQGQMTALQVRSNIKNQFSASTTSIQASENNPLKLSVSAEEALENILVRRGRGYLPPTETIRQGFKDIDVHQKAMPIAMETTFVQLMEKFDPTVIQDLCDKNNAGIMHSSKKAKYWDAFVSLYAEQVTGNVDAYQRLFMDDFSEAYEEAVQQLIVN